MYRKKNTLQLEFPDFYVPFSGQLDMENRWVVLAQLIPWDLVEEIYHADLSANMGAPIKSARLAFGALLIKEKQQLTDRETVQTIQENPYMQFLIGHEEFSSKKVPFDASLMVDFRKRFGEEGIQQIAEAIALAALQENDETTVSSKDDDDESTSPTDQMKATPKNRGKLIADATCAPADIRFPTDVSSLNEAREKTEEIIDELHQPLKGKSPRPRTHRRKARKKFVAFTKSKGARYKKIRKAKRQQLGYLSRNLRAIDQLIGNPDALPLSRLSRRLYKNLLVCREFHRQQLKMFEERVNRVDDRIVSLSQPHVRPIKRSKAGKDYEFGAKLSISVVEGFSFVERLSWNSFNELKDLVGQIERYREQFGYYPESVHVDKIYRTRANRKYCKERGIRMSGPRMGRPRKNVSIEEKRQAIADEGIRNHVESKFGQGKRRFGLGRIMAKLMNTSGAQISLSFLVMNIEEALKRFFLSIFLWCGGWHWCVLKQRVLISPTAPHQIHLAFTLKNHNDVIQLSPLVNMY